MPGAATNQYLRVNYRRTNTGVLLDTRFGYGAGLASGNKMLFTGYMWVSWLTVRIALSENIAANQATAMFMSIGSAWFSCSAASL